MAPTSDFQKLIDIMAKLRSPEGCPWDREQTFDTLKTMMLEEVYEIVEAVEERDYANLKEELGDLLLQIVFVSQMAHEQTLFEIRDVVESACDKMVRRHPHVFGEKSAKDSDEVLRNWEVQKREERKNKQALLASGNSDQETFHSVLEGTPQRIPALMEAQQISSKAARVGFDWSTIDEIFEKWEEEFAELKREVHHLDVASTSKTLIESEIGDLFFVLVNIARFLQINPESAIRAANRKFRARFRFVEEQLFAEGKQIESASMEEMEKWWQEAKRKVEL